MAAMARTADIPAAALGANVGPLQKPAQTVLHKDEPNQDLRQGGVNVHFCTVSS